jgi:hypothetical protein
MALWPRHRRTFFWSADFRGPAAPDGPPPCQRPCVYRQDNHASSRLKHIFHLKENTVQTKYFTASDAVRLHVAKE